MRWRKGTNEPGEYIRRWDLLDWALLVFGLALATAVIVAVVTV